MPYNSHRGLFRVTSDREDWADDDPELQLFPKKYGPESTDSIEQGDPGSTVMKSKGSCAFQRVCMHLTDGPCDDICVSGKGKTILS